MRRARLPALVLAGLSLPAALLLWAVREAEGERREVERALRTEAALLAQTLGPALAAASAAARELDELLARKLLDDARLLARLEAAGALPPAAAAEVLLASDALDGLWRLGPDGAVRWRRRHGRRRGAPARRPGAALRRRRRGAAAGLGRRRRPARRRGAHRRRRRPRRPRRPPPRLRLRPPARRREPAPPPGDQRRRPLPDLRGAPRRPAGGGGLGRRSRAGGGAAPRRLAARPAGLRGDGAGGRAGGTDARPCASASTARRCAAP